jgi:hypothetical protein
MWCDMAMVKKKDAINSVLFCIYSLHKTNNTQFLKGLTTILLMKLIGTADGLYALK